MVEKEKCKGKIETKNMRSKKNGEIIIRIKRSADKVICYVRCRWMNNCCFGNRYYCDFTDETCNTFGV